MTYNILQQRCFKMNNEQTIEFIEDYQSYECLWDINSPAYTKKNIRNHAYRELGSKYGITEKAVKNKIKNLRSYFSKEHQRVMEKKSGEENEYQYGPSWFAYEHMMFLVDSMTQRQTKDSLVLDATTGSVIIEECMESSQISKDDDNFTCHDYDSTLLTSDAPLEKQMTKKISKPTRTKGNVILKRKQDNDNKEECEIFKTLRTATTELTTEKDDCTIFGQMVTSELRKLNPRNKVLAKNKIQNIIFDLQLEEMQSHTSTIPESNCQESSSASTIQSPS